MAVLGRLLGAVAELLHTAGVEFAVLGNGETCTGDPARRAGNEFVFQGLASQNVETLTEAKAKKVVSTCAHCFNTLKNEYSQLGIELEVVHHTQLLNRLVREGKLTPVKASGGQKRTITYHDPCYVGRHNQVYDPPRELLNVIPDADFTEMDRSRERSFCCGAGGARMWMEENIGSRINMNRTDEAVATGADQIAVGCPFCRVMLSDGLTMKQSNGEARESVEVLDVAQMLLASVKGEAYAPAVPAGGAKPTKADAKAAPAEGDEATKPSPEPGDATQTEHTVTDQQDYGKNPQSGSGSSLFSDAEEKKPASTSGASGSSLFGDSGSGSGASKPDGSTSLFGDSSAGETESTTTKAGQGGSSLFDTPSDAPAEKTAAKETSSGGSLFDTPSSDDATAAPATEPKADGPSGEAKDEAASRPATGGGSLFDIGSSEPEQAAEPAPTAAPAAEAEPKAEDAKADA